MRRALLLALALFGCVTHLTAQIDTTRWLVGNILNDGSGYCRLPGNVAVSGGLLTLTETSGSYTCAPGGSGIPYATGMIFSKPSANAGGFTTGFIGGVFKASIRFGTPGDAIYSAFWLWGGASGSLGYPATCETAITNQAGTTMDLCTSGSSQTSYEIDIAEDPTSATTVNNNYITWVNGTSTQVYHGTCNASPDNGAAYHVYELDWFPTYLVYKVDGITCNQTTQTITVPMFIIFDQESPGTAGTTTNVDWVRVCSNPNAACNVGDTSMVFDDEFNQGVTPTVVHQAFQGVKKQGVKVQ